MKKQNENQDVKQDKEFFFYAQKNDFENMKLMLKEGYDINSLNDKGNTAYFEVASHLLYSMHNFNFNMIVSNPTNYNAVLSKLTVFFAENKADLNIKNKDGISILHLACQYKNNDSFIKLLIDKGADVNLSGTNAGITPLIVSAIFHNYSALKLLLENKADVNAKSDDNSNALNYISVQQEGSVPSRGVNVLEQLGFIKPKENEFNTEIVKIAKLLIDNGINVNCINQSVNLETKTPQNVTPLHGAINQENKEFIKLLVSNKADINVVNCFGKSPLSMLKNNKDLLGLLPEEVKKDDQKQVDIKPFMEFLDINSKEENQEKIKNPLPENVDVKEFVRLLEEEVKNQNNPLEPNQEKAFIKNSDVNTVINVPNDDSNGSSPLGENNNDPFDI